MIILASGSPRRRELLHQLGLEFEVRPAQGEEIITSDIPSEVVQELSYQKAMEIFSKAMGSVSEEVVFWQDGDLSQGDAPVNGKNVRKSADNFGDFSFSKIESPVVIGADTVVSYKQQILGKPHDREDARRMIGDIQGDTHEVYTGVSIIWNSDDHTNCIRFSDMTEVMVCPMTEDEIEEYISTDEPYDKAGAYGIQGLFAAWVAGIRGDYNNVVGLPVGRVYRALRRYRLI